MGVRFALTALLLLTACDYTSIAPNLIGEGSAARGKLAAERLGCGACHDITGVWPQGRTGPSLRQFAGRGLIAGQLPNRPDTVTAFLLDPSGTAMPKVAMSKKDAVDISSFLHQSNAD